MTTSNKKIIELIKRNPGELCFVYDSKTYEDYLKTYIDARLPTSSAVYNLEEFKILKDCFGTVDEDE